MERPRVTLEMIECVQRTLQDYKRCFAVMFLIDDDERRQLLPKDVLRLVWKSAAGSLEELLEKLTRRLVSQEFSYEGDDQQQIQQFLILHEARQRAPQLHVGCTCERAKMALRSTWFCWQELTPGQTLYLAKRLGLVEREYDGEPPAAAVQQQQQVVPKKRPRGGVDVARDGAPVIDLTRDDDDE